MAQMEIITNRRGVQVRIEGIEVLSVPMDDILDELDYSDIDHHFQDLHNDCVDPDYAHEDCPDPAEIVAEFNDVLSFYPADGWVHHIDSGHEGPFKFCVDPACEVLGAVQDTTDNILGRY